MKLNISKFILFALSLVYISSSCCSSQSIASSSSALTAFDAEEYDERLNFYVIADSGRNGYYEQKPVADFMGEFASVVEPEFVVSAGDTHHFMGVASTEDPLWMTNFELVYSHPELMVPFYPVLGNHEYRGNTQAVIDYSSISRRWEMPSRYYTKLIEDKDTSLRLIFVDTAPLIEKYRKDSESYPDAVNQGIEEQLQWIDSTLTNSTARWNIVIGHHPIYAYTTKSISERSDMQERLDTLLRRHDNVDAYICGHIHSFQHIQIEGSSIDYVVNSSASLSRDVEPIEGTKFCSPAEGFLLVSASDTDLEATMIDSKGDVLYSFTRE